MFNRIFATNKLQPSPFNNAILDDVSASPSKDSTSDNKNSFSILRNAFRQIKYNNYNLNNY
jgi:hypothetical protein